MLGRLNASHSYGLILLRLFYGYCGDRAQRAPLSNPPIPVARLLLLIGYAVLAKFYWFSVPFRGVLLSAGALRGWTCSWLGLTRVCS